MPHAKQNDAGPILARGRLVLEVEARAIQEMVERLDGAFERAVEIQPGHVEANLNLGTLREDEGKDEAALRHYRAALESDPLFPDTHVSLALIYEKLALPRTARAHWRRYLMLDPKGVWADLARQRVDDK